MVTKDQAMKANNFHYGKCTRRVGPRGAVRETSETWRRNGVTKTWVTRPDEFSVPIKYGLRDCSYLDNHNCGGFHTPEDCPLNDPTYKS